jgi:hypothetical protein
MSTLALTLLSAPVSMCEVKIYSALLGGLVVVVILSSLPTTEQPVLVPEKVGL